MKRTRRRRDEGEDENYVDQEEEKDDPPEGRALDSAADFKLGYFFRQLMIPKSVWFQRRE